MIAGCAASPGPVFLQPGTRLQTPEAQLAVDITLDTWTDYGGRLSPEQRDAVRETEIYVVTDPDAKADYDDGEAVRLARCSIVTVDGEVIPYIGLYDFVPYSRHLRKTLPHEVGHKIGYHVFDAPDANHDTHWLIWDVVVPEAEIRIANALEGR